ncbi:ABC-2 type transport system ATP-binding protein [Lactobacillus colini]|uniref:ABC-2 type transport system ATP-binding protein n=1 Tax=Lactobacillus colini TaxID=1819254 RepID=A0ABS4MFA3_9LACO|nr:ABC transporter ATP-binding protein [Lactobacillus colini]MBP2058361.1 ABC-2 type transport system ATP-binding protein [Lactobacillus colini]
MAYIELKNVSKQAKNDYILNDISLEIEKGQIVGFVGENGSGKTMLFRAILGFIKTSGEIKIDDQVVRLNSEMPVNVGTIIETPGFINSYTGLKNLEYLAAIKNLVNKDQIIAAMKDFGMDKYKDTKVKKYSLGMRQKLAIIQSYMEGQDLLVLDEPTNGLDDEAVEIFKQKMKSLSSQGKTILIASHDKDVINDLADKIYRVKLGKVSLMK